MKPKPSLTIAPVMVSDVSSLAVVGLTSRQFREFVAAHPEIPRVRHGKRVLVDVAFFRSLAQPVSSDAPIDEPGDDGPCTAEEVIAIARRRSA